MPHPPPPAPKKRDRECTACVGVHGVGACPLPQLQFLQNRAVARCPAPPMTGEDAEVCARPTPPGGAGGEAAEALPLQEDVKRKEHPGASCSREAPEGEQAGEKAGDEEEAEAGSSDDDIGDFLFGLLQELHPGCRVSKGSLSTLAGLMDSLLQRVVDEATAVPEEEPGADEAAGPAATSPNKRKRTATLTAADIQRALKRVLPGSGEPGRALRPYLPTAAKVARHLDKTGSMADESS